MSLSPRRTFENARVVGGVWLRDENGDAGPSFELLCVKNLPRLRGWNHSHVFDHFWRLYYNFTPGAYIMSRGKRHALGPAVFVIVPAGVLYETFQAGWTVDHFFLHFIVPSRSPGPDDAPFSLRADTIGLGITARLAAETRKTEPDLVTCRHLGLALLHHVPGPHLSRLPGAGQRPEITRLLREIEANPARFAGAGQMADFAGMSLRSLQRHFDQATGRSPLIHLREARLREAARQLVQTTHSIDQIADSLGFANRFHFSRLFRNFTGSPPVEFRRERSRPGRQIDI